LNSGLTLIHNPFLLVVLKWSSECELGFEVIKGGVIITGTSSPVTLGFDPEFLPQFSGIYSCINEGQNFQEAVIITTGTQ